MEVSKLFQFYYHKDKGLNNAIVERVKAAKFDVMALTVDTITGGNRERDLRTGFTSPPKLTRQIFLVKRFALLKMYLVKKLKNRLKNQNLKYFF